MGLICRFCKWSCGHGCYKNQTKTAMNYPEDCEDFEINQKLLIPKNKKLRR